MKTFSRQTDSLCRLTTAIFLGSLGGAASGQGLPSGTWAARRVTIPAAAQVDLSHLGGHTHANLLRFDTGRLNVAAMQADTTGRRYRSVRVVGHCRLSTDHAALPPGFEAFQKDVGPIPTYGSIDGTPGWSSHAVVKNVPYGVIFSVPTRFANWVAGQPVALRRRYKSPRSYSLTVTWEERKGG